MAAPVTFTISSRPSNTFPIPDRLNRLHELAYNLRWTWDDLTQDLFAACSPAVWERTRNPVAVLAHINDYRPLTESKQLVEMYDRAVASLDSYLSLKDSAWHDKKFGTAPAERPLTAYFCAEYGLHESFPGYSGGLGILAGDHCKAASDMNLPFIAVGLLYRNGYFRQVLDPEGRQEHNYPEFVASELPIFRVQDAATKTDLSIQVKIADRLVTCAVWQAKVGRISILMLDTNVPENSPEDREITRLLYVRGREMRLAQEIILGIGGVRALAKLGIKPDSWHLNEGHSACLLIERLGVLTKNQGLTFEDAVKQIQATSVFTIHTPVPAGNEVFSADLMQKLVAPVLAEYNLDSRQILTRGLGVTQDASAFDMTAFSLNMASHCNGVSLLHGKTAHGTWHPITGRNIIGITNGVHMGTWLGRPIRNLLTKYDLDLNALDLLATDEKALQQHINSGLARIPDAELWEVHAQQKRSAALVLKARLRNQLARNGLDPIAMSSFLTPFRDDILTIGFARRFATYKRAALLFTEPKRLAAILNNTSHPVQLVFAGKAHPADKPGQALIQDIISKVHKYHLESRIFFIEDYDMEIGKAMVQGVDVWLNNPRRPLEASGTSGMKAEANGVPNVSILDGWWDEGFTGSNGWAIGSRQVLDNETLQDKNDAQSLYTLLEGDVAAKFYSHQSGSKLPVEWVKIMRESIGSSLYTFATTRMLSDYVTTMYRKAGKASH
jgi:starch phosphorylase